MEPKTETFKDRTGWAPGPWDAEPDKMEWRHRCLPCLIVRGPSGALCGYVGLPPSHPMHSVYYVDVRTPEGDDPDAHGGLTYSDRCQPDGLICHVARPGEPDDVWWIGFDCAHSGDYCPKDSKTLGRGPHPYEMYRNIEYVKREVESLAEQMSYLPKRPAEPAPHQPGEGAA